MCDFISGYKLPNGELRFHTDADVEAARFNLIAPYAGKGQKDLARRAEALSLLGETVMARNPDHPHLFARRDIIAAENRLGIMWVGDIGDQSAGYTPMTSVERKQRQAVGRRRQAVCRRPKAV